jgi:hypothetical protein
MLENATRGPKVTSARIRVETPNDEFSDVVGSELAFFVPQFMSLLFEADRLVVAAGGVTVVTEAYSSAAPSVVATIDASPSSGAVIHAACRVEDPYEDDLDAEVEAPSRKMVYLLGETEGDAFFCVSYPNWFWSDTNQQPREWLSRVDGAWRSQVGLFSGLWSSPEIEMVFATEECVAVQTSAFRLKAARYHRDLVVTLHLERWSESANPSKRTRWLR